MFSSADQALLICDGFHSRSARRNQSQLDALSAAFPIAWAADLQDLPLMPTALSKLCTTFLNIAKHDKIMAKIHFTRTATQPHRNRKFRQFNNDQYSTTHHVLYRWEGQMSTLHWPDTLLKLLLFLSSRNLGYK